MKIKKTLTWLAGSLVLMLVAWRVVEVKSLVLAADACSEYQCENIDENSAEKITCIREKKACLEKKVGDLKTQKSTLNVAISQLNGLIHIQQLEIDQLVAEINLLEKEIDDLSIRISGLNLSLDRLSNMLVGRITSQYKQSNISPITVLLSSDSFNSYLTKIKYLRLAGHQTAVAMTKAENQRLEYDDQKHLKELKQKEVEDKYSQLEFEKEKLSDQKREQQVFLLQTENDEKKFQELLASVRADLDSITRALSSAGTKIGEVKRGEVISTVGMTGCTTGPHLHFEVFTDAKVENGHVVGNRTNPKPFLDNGQLQHPLPGSFLTADYGISYILGTHTGIDMAYSSGTLGSPIYAADSGIAYAIQDSSPCYLTNTVGKGLIIDHQNGLVTLYWHIP